jgi:fructose-bisphosphate aldolase class I
MLYQNNINVMHIDQMATTAQQLMADNKGLLAMDESLPNITRRFEREGIAPTDANRRAYRELIVTTPKIGEYLSGAILVEETIGQSTEEGIQFIDILREKGVMPGIKVDEGTIDLAGFPGEKITVGLDHLRERLGKFREMGLQFAKWRAAFTVGASTPTDGSIVANVHELARYAALCQEAGIVPVVEPEVVMEGSHDIHRSAEVTKHVLRELFNQLSLQQVHLRCMILKPNMVISGLSAPVQATVTEVSDATIDCLMETVPAAVPGIAFLSGGQNPEEATEHLNAIHADYPDLPWTVTFSYSRAIQMPAMRRWAGKKENVAAAQELLLQRLELLMMARRGIYQPGLEA